MAQVGKKRVPKRRPNSDKELPADIQRLLRTMRNWSSCWRASAKRNEEVGRLEDARETKLNAAGLEAGIRIVERWARNRKGSRVRK